MNSGNNAVVNTGAIRPTGFAPSGRSTSIDTAAKHRDADTADLFTEVSRGVDKLLWLVEAHMQSED